MASGWEVAEDGAAGRPVGAAEAEGEGHEFVAAGGYVGEVDAFEEDYAVVEEGAVDGDLVVGVGYGEVVEADEADAALD